MAVCAIVCVQGDAVAQVDTRQVVNIGRNALYFEDYVVSIQYFNQAIKAKPYLAQPYLFRSIAKLNLEDYRGAEEDASRCIELNPFITDAYEVRGVARQNLGKDREAVDDYSHALELLPNNRQLLFNKALAQSAVKDYAEADSTFAVLLKHYPGYENAYLGRARLRLEQTDTAAAIADIEHALSIDENSFNGHTMLADIAMRRGKSEFPKAIEHIDKAVKLQPRYAGLYVNRAYLKYSTDDWFGAMADYDYALELEPMNRMALFNRGLLEMEVNANDRALEDFNKVLELDPNDVRARYNRAIIYGNKHQYKKALADVEYVINAFPDFPTGYQMRSEYERLSGNLAAAVRDRDKARAISRRLNPDREGKTADAAKNGQPTETPDAELAKRELASLLTVDDNTDFRDEYNNSAIRGRIQDRNVSISIEPFMELTYYSSPSELRPNTYYIKEIDDLNSTRSLRFKVMVSNAVPSLADEELINRHFRSIDYYNSYLSTHKPRTIDYFGRAMDFVTVHNYGAAIRDLDRAIELTPDFAPAYMLRAQARLRQKESGVSDEEDSKMDAMARQAREQALSDQVLTDIDKSISLSPRNPFGYFNRGNMLIERDDLAAAAEAYSRAIELKPDFGEAYFNRGFVYLRLGNRPAGLADLGKAGELGVAAAYNLLKRMTK